MPNESHKKFDIDKYNDFIKKYKKSDYISKKSIKQMEDIGIEDSFPKINKRVNDCIRLLDNQDIQLLEDLLIEVKHEFNLEFVGTFNALYIDMKFPLSNFEIDIKDDSLNITDEIIKRTDYLVNSEIEKNRNKKGSWEKYLFSKLKDHDFISKTKIYPLLKIKMNFETVEFDERKKLFTRFGGVSNLFRDEIVPRYLDAIGHSYKFDIQNKDIDYYDGYAFFNIIIYLD
jgi:hypothetical protein